ncbi:MAG TPA: hypothetical protein PKI03_28290 [Pseudomonadota bacterium]|nr:hypothetical protein [Pseudomonadota bacterium]
MIDIENFPSLAVVASTGAPDSCTALRVAASGDTVFSRILKLATGTSLPANTIPEITNEEGNLMDISPPPKLQARAISDGI